MESILEVYKKSLDVVKNSSNKSPSGQKIYSSNDYYDIPFIILTNDFANLVQMAVARGGEVNIYWSSLQMIRNHLNLTNYPSFNVIEDQPVDSLFSWQLLTNRTSLLLPL